MLSVGLCLSARLPAGLLVFLGFVGSFGSIDHRLQQFELLPCGAVQTVDFFDHIVGVGGCDPFSEFVPSVALICPVKISSCAPGTASSAASMPREYFSARRTVADPTPCSTAIRSQVRFSSTSNLIKPCFFRMR